MPGPSTELGRELAASRPLAVLGHRISAPLAQYFAYAARRIHPDVRCLTFGGSVVFDALLHVSEAGGRWLLAIALPRYPAETVQALRFARRLGMRTAVITDVQFVPFAGDADVLLTAGVGSGLVFDSHAAPAVLAAVIVQAMADAEPARAHARLREYEQLSAGPGRLPRPLTSPRAQARWTTAARPAQPAGPTATSAPHARHRGPFGSSGRSVEDERGSGPGSFG